MKFKIANLGTKAKDLNFLLLTNPMSTILSLQVNLWVPVVNRQSCKNNLGTDINYMAVSTTI